VADEGRIRLADAVRYLRQRKNISARALSLQAGLSPSYVGKLEAGEIEPSVRAFALIALALSMSIQEIFFCVMQEGLLASGSPTHSDECHSVAV
jgi:transcriptional regulator with XRE-family HTH domain